MFWCVVSLYIFTRCLYFDEPYGLVKIATTSKNMERYYTPKHLIRYIYTSFLLPSFTLRNAEDNVY